MPYGSTCWAWHVLVKRLKTHPLQCRFLKHFSSKTLFRFRKHRRHLQTVIMEVRCYGATTALYIILIIIFFQPIRARICVSESFGRICNANNDCAKSCLYDGLSGGRCGEFRGVMICMCDGCSTVGCTDAGKKCNEHRSKTSKITVKFSDSLMRLKHWIPPPTASALF